MKNVFFLICIIPLSACNIGSMARVNPHTVAVYRPVTDTTCPLTRGLDDTQAGSIDLDCFRFNRDDEQTAYRQATDSGSSEEAQQYARNRLTAALISHADNVCELEKGRIVGREGALNFGLGTATSALATISSIVGGELAKSILAGGATFTNAVRGHANESFYRNQVTQAITAAMDGERDRILTIIEGKRSDPVRTFTADDAIRVTNQYHQACSFQRGLQLLIRAAVNQPGLDAIVAQRNTAASLTTLNLELASVVSELRNAATTTERRTALEQRRTQLEQARDRLLGVGQPAVAGQ